MVKSKSDEWALYIGEMGYEFISVPKVFLKECLTELKLNKNDGE